MFSFFKYRASDHFNSKAVAEINKAKEVLGLESDSHAVAYAIELLGVARKAKELGGELCVAADNGHGGLTITKRLTVVKTFENN